MTRAMNWRLRWKQSALKEPGYAYLFDPPDEKEVICIDTETSGLDPQKAELLFIGAVPVKGNRIELSRALRLKIRPKHPLATESVKNLGLQATDLQDGMAVEEALRQLLPYIGNRPVTGYYLEFDIAMLDKYLRPWLGIGLPNRQIEVSSIYHDQKIGLIPMAPVNLSFAVMRQDLGIPLWNPNDLLANTIMTAMMYVRLNDPARR